MRIASPSRLMMVARTDKEARLKDFIIEGLARRAEDPVPREPITIFVRNPDSPAARALHIALTEACGEAAELRVVLGETHTDEPASTSLLDISGAELRVLGDPRFGAAHEQLVVGDKHVWIGDCLRRDPTKRDAFEIYHSGDQTIRWLSAESFRKLWAIAKPFTRTKADAVALEIIATGHPDDPAAQPRNHRH